MRVIIVDDEQAMLMIMERLLQEIQGTEIAGSFLNAAEALAFIRHEDVDIAFVDIEISGENGLEAAKTMREACPGMEIVFVTSHKEYALDAFAVYPLDYMVKPVSMGRIRETMLRVMRRKAGRLAVTADRSDQRLNVRALGAFEASSLQAGKVKWMSKKSQEIFGYLLLNRGKSVSKSRLLEDIFPYMDLPNAQHYLNTAIYQLRKALTAHGLKASIITGNEQYSLDLKAMTVDFIDFESATQALQEIDASNVQQALNVEGLYGGELFEERSYEWSVVERGRLGERYGDLAKRLVRWLAEQGQLREASRIALKLTRFNELDEIVEWDDQAWASILS